MFKMYENTVLWAKIGKIDKICFMAKDIIILGIGCIIQFIDVNTGEETQFILNNHRINGDGVKALRGHPYLYIFAYVENCQSPNLYVKGYPDFEIVAKFTDLPMEGCKGLAFSETSLLFSLGEMPNYRVTVWNWRTLEKFAESSNELFYEDQVIKCSFGRPIFLAQVGKGSNKLFIWDVFTVCKKSTFSKHTIRLGTVKPAPFVDVVWTTDCLCILDTKGSIYTVNKHFFLELIIDFAAEGNMTPAICMFRNGLTVYCPNKEIRHYKKIGNNWTCDWSYETTHEIHSLICNRGDKMVAINKTYEILTFSNTLEEETYLKYNQSCFDKFSIIYPEGEFICVLCNKRKLIVYSVQTGVLISTLDLELEITDMAENPEYPCVAISGKCGNLQFISVYNEAKPSVMVTFDLTDKPLQTVRFFERGGVLVTGCLDIGEFFILKGLPGTKIEVVTCVEAKQQIIDYFLVSSQDMYRLFLLPVTHDTYYAGNSIIRYCIVGSEIVNVKKFHFENESTLYHRLVAKKGPGRDRMFYALPFSSKLIHAVETKRGDFTAYVSEQIRTGHQLKHFSMDITQHYALTWSYCGLIIAHTADFKTPIGLTLTNHRNLQGVKLARITPLGNIIIALGREGVLTATSLDEVEVDEDFKKQLKAMKNSTKYALMFKRPTLGYTVEEKYQGKNWLEIQRLKAIEKEEEICRSEKNKILKEFADIKEILGNLVTRNLEGPENEKIDLIEFYLDTALYQKKQQENKEECKKTETYLNCLIAAQDRVSEYIVKNYWDKMDVTWNQIHGFFSATKATNYCLLPENVPKLQRLAWIEELREIEQFLTSQDAFEPWVSVPEEKLLELVEKKPILPKEDYSGVTAHRRAKQIEEMDSAKSLETKIALAGSVSQLYIEPSLGHYKQRQLVSFYQSDLQQAVAEQEVIKLKKVYNKCFMNMKSTKEREMYNVREKNARLRHIISEYNYFSQKKVDMEVPDPQWNMTENPVTVLSVTDDELSVTPYISPSEQAILDAKAADQERLRLLLLADDFRERALMAMMNGVLEVRWEDELKKNVPKPKCMLEKQPEEYKEEDLKAIRDYEEKVVQLEIEREKYKSLLEVEFSKLSASLRDSIRKFNQRLYECTKFKFYIDSGMNQENLQVNRARVNQFGRIEIGIKEKEIIESITQMEKSIEKNLKYIAQMQEALQECKANLDSMQAKEKNLDKSYRKDFQDMSPVVQEQVTKLYKRRPKASFRHINTATILLELAKGILTTEKTYGMTQDCIDYLKSLDQLDMFVGLPATIDEHVWSMICRHRRIRIEYEIKLRAAQVSNLDGEASIATLQKRVQAKKERVAELHAELEQVRADRLYLMHNKQVQIVLRRGLVEIPLSGDIFHDFEEAILVPKKEIEEVNRLIIGAGKFKLKSIKQNMKFRRNVMATEWEHMKLRMQINDLIEQRRDIEVVKFTKEMQLYLKNKSLGRKAETGSYEIDVDLMTTNYENRIKDKKDKYAKIKKQIRAYQENNKNLDAAIKEVNMDVCDFKLQKDIELETKEKDILDMRMNAMIRRSCLVQQIQKNHNDILILQTELELLRLKTFPTFKYNVIHRE